MKKYIYVLIVITTFFVYSCGDTKEFVENKNNEEIKDNSSKLISFELNANLGEKTRTVFNIEDGYFPRPTDLIKGEAKTIICIFRSSDESQPTTIAKLDWEVVDGGVLKVKDNQQIDFKGDISKGEWFVMGIMGGNYLSSGNNVSGITFNRCMKYVDKDAPLIEADIPYVFSWRKLDVDVKNQLLRSKRDVTFMPLGTFVSLKIKNKTKFGISYSGVRLISSSPLKGRFMLNDNAIKQSELEDTPLNNIKATDDRYAKLLSFVPTIDHEQRQGRAGGFKEVSNKYKNATTGLFYNDISFDEEQLEQNEEANSFVCVWMMPQMQTISVYSDSEDVEGDNNEGDKIEIMKTQFLLHSRPTQSKDPAINMLPICGITETFKSGQVHTPFIGNAVFNYTPIHIMAKLDNLDPDDDNYSDNKAYYSNTKYYEREEMKSPSAPKTGYFLPGRGYWNAIFAPYCFGALASEAKSLSWDYYSCIVPSNFYGVKKTYLNAYSSYKYAEPSVRGKVGYAICLSKPQSYMVNPRKGAFYRGAHVKNATKQQRFQSYYYDKTKVFDGYDVATSNKLQYAIRAEVENRGTEQGRLKLVARYLGSECVLDIADISEEMFWETKNADAKKDVYRYIPYNGCFRLEQIVRDSEGNKINTFYAFADKGLTAQYWINERFIAEDAVQSYSMPLDSSEENHTYYSITIQGEGTDKGEGGYNGKIFGLSGYLLPIIYSKSFTSGENKSEKTKIAVRLMRNKPFTNND